MVVQSACFFFQLGSLIHLRPMPFEHVPGTRKTLALIVVVPDNDYNIFATPPTIQSNERAMQELSDNLAGGLEQSLASAAVHERRRLLAFIRARIPSDVDAEDIVQDVFCDLLDAYNAMKPIGHAGAWMMQVAKNRIVDLFRSTRRRASQELATISDLLPSPEAGPDAIFARSVLVAELERALEELPPNQRDVFLAHEVAGLSFAEISAKTGLSVNTLLSRKHYAVRRLRARLLSVYREAGIERKQK